MSQDSISDCANELRTVQGTSRPQGTSCHRRQHDDSTSRCGSHHGTVGAKLLIFPNLNQSRVFSIMFAVPDQARWPSTAASARSRSLGTGCTVPAPCCRSPASPQHTAHSTQHSPRSRANPCPSAVEFIPEDDRPIQYRSYGCAGCMQAQGCPGAAAAARKPLASPNRWPPRPP